MHQLCGQFIGKVSSQSKRLYPQCTASADKSRTRTPARNHDEDSRKLYQLQSAEILPTTTVCPHPVFRI